MRNISLSILSIATLLGLAACGSDEKPAPQTTVVAVPAGSVAEPTKGQQLRDLQKAYDDDAIDSDEYEAQKARVLN